MWSLDGFGLYKLLLISSLQYAKRLFEVDDGIYGHGLTNVVSFGSYTFQ